MIKMITIYEKVILVCYCMMMFYLGVQILSFSCSFGQKNCLAHPLWELAPPQEIPGSPWYCSLIGAKFLYDFFIPKVPVSVRFYTELFETHMLAQHVLRVAISTRSYQWLSWVELCPKYMRLHSLPVRRSDSFRDGLHVPLLSTHVWGTGRGKGEEQK